jgi:hypothetical protein
VDHEATVTAQVVALGRAPGNRGEQAPTRQDRAERMNSRPAVGPDRSQEGEREEHLRRLREGGHRHLGLGRLELGPRRHS